MVPIPQVIQSERDFLKAGVILMFMGEYNHTIDTKGRLIILPNSEMNSEMNLW